MRLLLLISFSILFTSLLHSQNRPDSDLKNEDGDAIQIDQPLEWGEAFSGSPELKEIAAGDAIEGDFHISPRFQPGSPICWVAHRTTDNISIVDVENATLLTTIDSDDTPTDIAFNDELALVACLAGRSVQLFDLSTYDLLRTIDLPGEPINVEVSDNGKFAIVGMQEIELAVVIDLSEGQVIRQFSNFPTGVASFSFITSNTRNHYAPSGIAISPDGLEVATGAEAGLLICDVGTGECDTLEEVQNALQVGWSQDGSSIVALSFGSEGQAFQIDAASRNLITTISPAESINWSNGDLAINNDGSRVFAASTNSGMFIRFDMADYEIVTTTTAVFWTDITKDGNTAIAGGFQTHLIDMGSGDIQGTTEGISLNTGAVSDDGGHILAMDPLRRERAETYLASPNGIFPIDPVSLGSDLEGDATYSVTFTPDGQRLLAVNSLSGTVSVIDVASATLEKIIPLEWYEVYHVGISPDSKIALIGERLNDQVTVIDLDKLEVITSLNSFGDRPDQTWVHPNGEKAYALNAGSTDNISVIDLTANPPQTVKNIVCGNVGISWINYGIRCNLAITEDGSRGVLAVPFDDGIQIIDLEDDEVKTTFPVEGFPLQTVLSDDIEGKIYAAVTLRNADQVWVAEDILGDVVPFGGVDVGTAPTRMGYDPATKRFAVCSNTDRTVNFIDPLFFEVNETKSYGPTHTPISVEFNDEGDRFTLLRSNETGLPHQLDINDERVDLPGLPIHNMALSPDGMKAAIPAIADDAVYLIDANVTSSEDVTVIQLREPFILSPSPFDSEIRLLPQLNSSESSLLIEMMDMTGKLVATWSGLKSPNLSYLATGAYALRVKVEDRVVQQGRVIKK